MSFAFWQVSAPDFEKVRAVMNRRGTPLSDASISTPTIVFCARPDAQGLAEVTDWIAEFGAACRVEAAGTFVFFEFEKETDAVAFKLRWYAR